MKLFITPGSPYARMARIVLLEKGLQDRVEVVMAKTRTPDSPYYVINPSGRVPFLQLDDGTGLEESALICAYLDELDGTPTLEAPDGWGGRRLEAMARSMLDGLSLLGREYIYRPAEIRSSFIIDHETARAERMADAFEREIDHPALTGPLNMVQITLACTLHGRESRPPGFDWRRGRPGLAAWVDRIGERPSLLETLPPPRDH